MAEENFSFQDTLIGILANFPEEQQKFRNDRKNLNTFFYGRKDDFSVLNGMFFESVGAFPTSRDLEENLANLMKYGFIHLEERDNNKFVINIERVKAAYSLRLNNGRYSPEERQEVESLGRDFYLTFGAK